VLVVIKLKTHQNLLVCLLFLIAVIPTFLCLSSFGQSYSRIEVGAEASSLLLVDPISNTEEKAGFGTRLTYNFSPILALDAEGDFFPSTSLPGPQRGGRAFLAMAGPKAGWRWRRVGLFVKARPGVINFSNVLKITTGILPGGVPFFTVSAGGHRTHLALDLGGVLEINTSRRTMIRIDAGEMLIRYDDRTYRFPGVSGASINAPGVIGNSLLVSAGLSYRLGNLGQRSVSLENAKRWEVGVQYCLLSMGRGEFLGVPSLVPSSLGDDPGFGGRVTYNLNRWVALDSAVNYFYRNPHVGDAQRGGRILQGCFGPKIGLRTQRAGFFVKARPGFLSYGGVHDSAYPPFPTARLTHFALDVGGVLEFYPSPRTVLRFDLGHTLGFYGAHTFRAPISLPFPNGDLHSGGFRDNGMQLTTGFGWRF
jgi:hypothetical protein